MRYSTIKQALEAVLPGTVYKVEAPNEDAAGAALTRYLVWTPTGTRPVSAEGTAFCEIGLYDVTVATQQEDDPLTAQVVNALRSVSGCAVGQSEQSYDDQTMTYYTDIPCEVIEWQR